MASSAMAQSLNLYTQWSSYSLAGTSEAGAIAYSRDTDSLYSVGDEGGAIVRYSKTGQILDQFMMIGPTSKPDTEGITYLGGGKFLVADERTQSGYVYTFVAGGSGSYSASYNFAAAVGNIGLEGVAYDPATNSVWGVKETAPQAVYQMINFGASGQEVIVNPGAPWGLSPSRLGLTDLSDIYALSASQAFIGTGRELNLLILSQEARRIIEVTREGDIVSSIDISFLGSTSIEGMTMDDNGTLYLAAESTLAGGGSTMFVLNAVPEPSTYALIGLAGIAGLVTLIRRSRERRQVA